RLPVEVMYAVPVIIVSLVLTILFDSRVSLFATLTLAFLGSLMLRFDFLFTFATVFAGALGIFSVRDIKNRGQFFVSAGLVFLGYVFVLVGDWLITATTTDQLLWDVLLVGINAVLLLLAMPLLWVFERAFDITTDLTLLELSDTNRPLLKELSLRAPGTFNHVLQVANLAEAAADAIGANALLTRVGALYHDIGKMVKPEYFVENQRPGQNPHDHLKPRMSALIIASHVKEGLEIGRKYRLPKVVLDFIPMHHGTTRIEYFYRKALEQAGEGDPPVLESEFRYPGPKPNTKETSILMLADSVEAASRTLANPTHKRLESLIDMIIRARLDDGQLEDSELTFRDLTIIKQTFLSMLMAIYHVRVKYPGQEKTQDEEGTTKKETQGEDEGASERATSSEENRPEAETKKGEEGPKAA
ncbi:MAG: HDIG domain-containing protein, partial [Bacteroidetes bacterium]